MLVDSTQQRPSDRYIRGELLGRGGMGEVYAGYALGSHGFQKPVAIKRMLPAYACDAGFVERLVEEAKLLVGLQHGNIVSVLDLARDGDDVLLVMEYIDGPSLYQLLRKRCQRTLSFGVATYIVQSAAAGLEFAHARPGGAIIHADVSPGNLLLTRHGEVRVADFGIARREGGATGVVEGKWAYMAPEQAWGEALTPSSDVFALGVVLYELVTGRNPFGKSIGADERYSGPLHLVPPRMLRADVPRGLDAICMRALAENPRERYARMQHLVDDLVEERFANGWREGAAELAQAIAEVLPDSLGKGVATQMTRRPVTIATHSLINDSLLVLSHGDVADGSTTTCVATHYVLAAGSEVRRSPPARGSQSPIVRIAVASVLTRQLKYSVLVLAGAAAVGVSAGVALELTSGTAISHAPRIEDIAALDTPALPSVKGVTREPVVDAPPEDVPVNVPKRAHGAKKAKRESAVLRVNSYDADSGWISAYVGNQRQDVPGAKFVLAPGHYTVRLRSPALKRAHSCGVTLAANARVTLRVDPEAGVCEIQ